MTAASNEKCMPHTYQLFPKLLHDDEAAVRASIRQFGVLVKIIRDQDGNLIEGHLRKRIADEEGKPCPEEIRHFASEQEKFQYVLLVNAARRHLATAQKRDVISAYLVRDPEISNNWLSEMLSVSVNTVISERERLESTFQIEKLEKLRGKDGKKRTAKTRHNAKPVPPALKHVENEDQDTLSGIPFENNSDPPVSSATNADELTAEEYKAVIDFVTVVGGWARAKAIMTKGEMKWKQNQDG